VTTGLSMGVNKMIGDRKDKRERKNVRRHNSPARNAGLLRLRLTNYLIMPQTQLLSSGCTWDRIGGV